MAQGHDVPKTADAWALVSGRALVLGLLAVVAAAHLPTLGFGFVYDDHWTLLGNGFLRQPGDLGLLLSPDATARHVPDAFRPTAVVFDVATYQLLGIRYAWLHHAVSVLLHLTVCAAIVRWLSGLGAPVPLRIATAALFGVLAIHAEAVAVVSFREDLLAAALGVAAMIAADRGIDGPAALDSVRDDQRRPRPHGGWLAAALLLQALATGAKLSAAPLPVVWVLARALLRWRRVTAPAIAWGASALVAGTLLALAQRMIVAGGISPYEGPRVLAEAVGLGPVLAASTQIHAQYVVQSLVGVGLRPEYVDYTARWGALATVLCGAGLLALLLAGIAAARGGRRPVAAFAILAAFVLALPTANIVPLPNMRADRFMYLPSLPMCLGLAALLLAAGRSLAARSRSAAASIGPLVGVLVLQGALGQGAAAVYRSDTRLWEIALRYAPDSARAHAVRGELYVARMRASAAVRTNPIVIARARAHCSIAVRLDPRDDLSHLCQARLATVEKTWTRADEAFRRALHVTTTRRDRALLALASLSLDLPGVPYDQRKTRAFAHLDAAVDAFPYSAEAHAVAGRIHHRLGDAERAALYYRRASKLRPERWDLVLWGVELHLDLGHPSAARGAWTRAEDLLRSSDPAQRSALRRRLQDAEAIFDPTPFTEDH